MENILLSTEIEFIVDSLQPQSINDIGNQVWLNWHQRLQKLNQQALIEASALSEEYVKENLVCFGKVPVLVHEAILINIWKHKVLPHMLKMEDDPENSFLAYSVLYHEQVCVGLLEIVMYHASCCEALGDAASDLLDYAYGAASQLLSIKPIEVQIKTETIKQELDRQMNNLGFDIGMRCLGIIRYISENLEGLPCSVCSRIYNTCDVPMLFIELLFVRPWVKDGKQYLAGKWQKWDGEALIQAEAQVWLTLRQLLLDPACREYYSVTEGRRMQIVKLMQMLTPVLLDQVAPLIELKQWLSHICMTEQPAKGPKPVLLETVLEIKENILKQCKGKWKKIAREQLPLIFCKDHSELVEKARQLSDAYNIDLLEKLDAKEKAVPCKECGKDALQRCSHCKQAWYCSRSCQVKNWNNHKEECNKITGNE